MWRRGGGTASSGDSVCMHIVGREGGEEGSVIPTAMRTLVHFAFAVNYYCFVTKQNYKNEIPGIQNQVLGKDRVNLTTNDKQIIPNMVIHMQ